MPNDSADPIPLVEPEESAQVELRISEKDRRPKMPEPLPVRLMTVEDARLIAGAGVEKELDAFYVAMLGFERQATGLHYRAENFRVLFTVAEPPVHRDDMRALGIEVLSLREAEQELIDREIKYLRQRGLHPGQETLLLQDPAGNWIELSASSKFQ